MDAQVLLQLHLNIEQGNIQVLQGNVAGDADDVREMLERMNRFLVERTEGEKYATLFYSLLSADGRE